MESEQNRVLARHSGLGLFIVWLLQFYPREVDLLALCFRCTALLARPLGLHGGQIVKRPSLLHSSNETCASDTNQAVPTVLNAMLVFQSQKSLVLGAAQALGNLCLDPKNIVVFVADGGVHKILRMLRRYAHDPKLVLALLNVLVNAASVRSGALIKDHARAIAQCVQGIMKCHTKTKDQRCGQTHGDRAFTYQLQQETPFSRVTCPPKSSVYWPGSNV